MLKKLILPLIKYALLSGFIFSTSASAAAPNQWIAQLYVEALGSAPDPSGWKASVTPYAASCNLNKLKATAKAILDSPEFSDLGYTNEEKVLVLYRAVLLREPEIAGYNGWKSKLSNGTITWPALIDGFLASTEFGFQQPDQAMNLTQTCPTPTIKRRCNNF